MICDMNIVCGIGQQLSPLYVANRICKGLFCQYNALFNLDVMEANRKW